MRNLVRCSTAEGEWVCEGTRAVTRDERTTRSADDGMITWASPRDRRASARNGIASSKEVTPRDFDQTSGARRVGIAYANSNSCAD